MGVETFTNIASLNENWPLGSDTKSEGDDHLRGIKKVIKADAVTKAELSNATTTARMRNRIVNGAMQISQENGNTVGTVNAYYGADQFFISYVAPSAAFQFRQNQPANPTPNGSEDRLLFNTTTAKGSLAATDLVAIGTKIEGVRMADFLWGSATARQVILRFNWNAPAGTYTLAIQSVASERCYLAAFTSTGAGDQEITLVIPGDAVVNAAAYPKTAVGAISIWWVIAAGSTYTVASGGWQAGGKYAITGQYNGIGNVTGSSIYLADVGLYLDPNNTGIPPAWEMPDEAQELAACMRYWYKASGIESMFSGDVTTSGSYYAAGIPPVTMRSSPTITGVNANAGAFPATTGSLIAGPNYYRENRVANATAAGFFYSTLTLNARM